MSQTFHPIAQIVIHRDGKFLLTKRRVETGENTKYDGFWQIPTGTLEFGEDIQSIIVREAQEELGIDVVLERTLAVTEKVEHDSGWHGVFMAFLCRQVDPNQPIKINHESYEYGWYSIDQINSLKVIPSTVDVLEHVNRYYRLFSLGALAVIKQGDMYLLTKIFNPHDSNAHGKWGFVAGVCEPSEVLEDTVRRECLEELGTSVEIDYLLPHVVEQDNKKVFCYLAHLSDPISKISINNEASEWGWFTREQMKSLDLFGDTIKILNTIP